MTERDEVAQIDMWLDAAFPQTDAYHGVAHARTVRTTALAQAMQEDEPLTGREQWIVTAATLLHDTGYAFRQPDWSPDRREHVRASLDYAAPRLATLPSCQDDPDRLYTVLWIIANHDETNFNFPSLVWDGGTGPRDLGPIEADLMAWLDRLSLEQRQRNEVLLGLVQEADALAATGTAGAERTWGYATERSVPLAGPGNPVNAWCWEESVLGNIRIGAKRAIIDARTPSGRRTAWAAYDEIETFIAVKCTHLAISYQRESFTSQEEYPEALASALPFFRLDRYRGWPVLRETLRAVTLMGDPSIRPYTNATIAIRYLPLAHLFPIARYVLREQLQQHRSLHWRLQRSYALSLFDLTGMISYRYGERTYTMAPPIIETAYEPERGEVVSSVLDGLHRVWLAREMGMEGIWAVEISDIPNNLPNVALPVKWDDVQVVDRVPETEGKRRFRYASLAAFEQALAEFAPVVTEDTYRYFLYRNLNVIGSTGIRSS